MHRASPFLKVSSQKRRHIAYNIRKMKLCVVYKAYVQLSIYRRSNFVKCHIVPINLSSATCADS